MLSPYIVNDRGYPDSVIESALRGKEVSPVVSFRYDLLNRSDVKIGEILNIESGGVSYNETRAVKRMGSFNFIETGNLNINFMTDQIQPWFVLHMPQGGTVEWPLGIFMLESPERQVNGKVSRRNIAAYDKGLILTEWKLTSRQYFTRGTNYVAAIEQLLSMAGMNPGKVDIAPGDAVMETEKEFPIGTSAYAAINELLDAINYVPLSIDAMGAVWSEPYLPPTQRIPDIFYVADKHSIVEPGFTDNLSIAKIPNVFTVVAENLEGQRALKSVYVNNNIDSPVSVRNRGREVMADVVRIKEISDQETLDARAKRIAIEATSAYRNFKFSTLLNPEHGEGNTVYLDIPGVIDIPAKFIETAWGMDLKVSGVMTHECRMAVDLN